MKKILLALGCVAIVGLGVYGYQRHQMSSPAIRKTIDKYCSDKQNVEMCRCFHTSLWVGFGQKKYYKVVELMRADMEEEVSHVVGDMIINSTAGEMKAVRFYDEAHCPQEDES